MSEEIQIIGMKSDTANIIAFGTAKLKKNKWFKTKISFELLEKAVKSIKALGDVEEVELIFSEGTPLIIGKVEEKNNTASGIIIAPRSEQE